MTQDLAENDKQKYLREEYVFRINRVIDYIQTNIDQDLSMETLSDIACFSRFHFHRLFGAIVGETLSHFIQRIRVEKAASRLIYNPKVAVSQIALDCGFSSSAVFARAFKEYFGMNASQWRMEGHKQMRKKSKLESNENQPLSKKRKEYYVSSSYTKDIKQIWRIIMNEKPQIKTDVEVKEMPELDVAYVRHIGPYKGDSDLFGRLFEQLMKWAGPRDLLSFPETQILSVYYDDPDITDDDKLRVDACITVPKETPAEGKIGRMSIPGGKYAVAHFEIDVDQYEDAWNMVFGGWLPESGYQPADGPCYELCLNLPAEHPEGKHIVDICVPVKPL